MSEGTIIFCPACSMAHGHNGHYPDECERCSTALHRPRYPRRKANLNSHSRRSKMAKLVKRDGKHCWLCYGSLDFDIPEGDPWAATIDHYVAVARGGSNALENLRLAHATCNSERGTGSLDIAHDVS